MTTIARRRPKGQQKQKKYIISEQITGNSVEIAGDVMISNARRAVAVDPKPTNTTVSTNIGWPIKQKLDKAAFIIEQPHIVTLFLLIVMTDIVLGSMSLHGRITNTPAIDILRHVILYLQGIELMMQMFLFHVRFFSHWGYCFDTLLVGAKLFNGQYNYDIRQDTLHLLSFLRLWRFIRVVQSFLAVEISRHNRTKEELLSLVEYTTEYKTKVSSMEKEVEMLREALNVAALDVVEMRATIQ